MNTNKEENMSSFVGVVLPLLLIFIANAITAKYQKQESERQYKDYVTRFTGDVMKQIKELTSKE